MDPQDPADARFGWWEHEDCLEHPELALSCGDGEQQVVVPMKLYGPHREEDGNGHGSGEVIKTWIHGQGGDAEYVDSGIAIFCRAEGRGDGMWWYGHREGYMSRNGVDLARTHDRSPIPVYVTGWLRDAVGFCNDDDGLAGYEGYTYSVEETGW